jgi:hypothetical protein
LATLSAESVKATTERAEDCTVGRLLGPLFALVVAGSMVTSATIAHPAGAAVPPPSLHAASSRTPRSATGECTIGRTFADQVRHRVGVCGFDRRWVWRNAVVQYGDSLSSQSAPYTRYYMDVGGEYALVSRTLGGTAPCDWLPKIRADIRAYAPAAAVFQFSGNAIGTCMTASRDAMWPSDPNVVPNAEPYYEQYERDTRTFVRVMRSRRVAVFIAASPPAPDFADASNGWGRLDDIYRRVAAEEGAFYLGQTRLAVSNPDGTRVEALPCLAIEPCLHRPASGYNQLFAPDGAHFGCAVPVAPPVNGVTAPCPAHSSGALRYGLAIVRSVREHMEGKRFRAPRLPRSLAGTVGSRS